MNHPIGFLTTLTDQELVATLGTAERSPTETELLQRFERLLVAYEHTAAQANALLVACADVCE